LSRGKSWAFRRQAEAFVADIVEQRTPWLPAQIPWPRSPLQRRSGNGRSAA